jgi:hypothetical protein
MALDNSPVWTGNTSLTYNIQDLDGFSPAGYIDARWGNFQSVDSSTIFNSTILLPCTPLTLGSTDLFISTSRTVLTGYSVPSQDYANFQVSFQDTSGVDWNLYRYLHFNDAALFPSTATKLIILIHGWNPSSNADPFSSTQEFVNLYNNLVSQTTGTDWSVVKYNWAIDSDTGPADIDAAVNATYAAEIGHQHGQHLGQLLSVLYPNLQEVQFIAHSDGAWVARGAARNLLADEPNVKVEVTLLDPFMPNTVPLISSVLGDSIMDQLPSIPGNANLYILENYFADDQLVDGAFGTQDVFTWRATDIGGERIDWSPNGGSSYYYQTHAGPIQWYSDTIYQFVFPGSLASLQPFDLSHLGWRRSLFNNEPIIITQPPSTQAVATGSSLSLSASASTRDRTAFPSDSISPAILFQWYKSSGSTWVALSGQTQSNLTISSAQPTDAGQYLVLAYNSAGSAGDTATVTVTTAVTSFATWVAANNLTQSAPTDDPAHDGIPNLIKYAVNLDPNKHEASPVQLSMDSTNLYLTYTKARSELGYSVQTSTDLQTWTTAGVNQGGPGPTVIASVPIGTNGRRFLRLSVTMPP